MDKKETSLSIESALYALLIACQRRFSLDQLDAYEQLVFDLYNDLGGKLSTSVCELIAEAEECATPGRILNAPVPVVDRVLASEVAACYASQLYARIGAPEEDDDLDEVWDEDEWMTWYNEATHADQAREYVYLHSVEFTDLIINS